MASLGTIELRRPMLDMPKALEYTARPSELIITDPLRQTWRDLARMITYVDNRCDSDYPDSRPEEHD